MRCNNPSCKKEIPKTRKSTAKHCSDDCYDEMKKIRSRKRYEAIRRPVMEINRNELILEQLYLMQQLGKPVTGRDLEKLGFNFGISTGETMAEKSIIAKIVGKYAYHVNNEYNLKIWKLKSLP
jgi:hypothetical protein